MPRPAKLTPIIVSLTMLASLIPGIMAHGYEQQKLELDPTGTVQQNSKLGAYSNDELTGPTGGPILIAAQIVNVLLLLLGTLCLCLYFYAGYIWIMSRGNEEEAKRAKDILIGTSIGLLFVLASYSIISYIFRNLTTVTA